MTADEAAARQQEALACANQKDWDCAFGVLTQLMREEDYGTVVPPQNQEVLLLNFAASGMYFSEGMDAESVKSVTASALNSVAAGYYDAPAERSALAESMFLLLRAESCDTMGDTACAVEAMQELTDMKSLQGWEYFPLTYLKRSDGTAMKDVLARLETTYGDQLQ